MMEGSKNGGNDGDGKTENILLCDAYILHSQTLHTGT